MKTKKLDPQNLCPKEDWESNNIAFACPACGEVYIVSERIPTTTSQRRQIFPFTKYAPASHLEDKLY